MSNVKKKRMETNANFWRSWWNSQSHKVSSDYEADRVTAFRNEEMEQLAEKELLEFVNPQDNDFVFDVGCGTGVNINRIYSKVRTIIGMDIAEGMIERCRRRIYTENISNTRLMLGNITNIPLKSNTFDKIICMSVLHYLNDEECEASLKELVRISKNNAIVVFHVKNLFSLYLCTLYLAKKIKSLFTKKAKTVYYRSYRWYEFKLSELGADLIDYNSISKFIVEFFPKILLCSLQKIEVKFNRGRILRKYGADFKMKVRIKKH